MFVFDRANQGGDAVSCSMLERGMSRRSATGSVCVDSTHIFSRRAGRAPWWVERQRSRLTFVGVFETIGLGSDLSTLNF